MKNLFLSLPLAAALVMTQAVPAFAVDEINVSRGATLAGPGLAAHGYDVVAYFGNGAPTVGNDKFAVAHNGATYRFASQANLDAFKANPAKYEPAYGGFCAYGVALNKKLDGDPRYWKIVDGKLYLNLNADIQAEWSKDVPGNLGKAEGNWKKIHDVAVGKL
jgi:YHS domain-containing protein